MQCLKFFFMFSSTYGLFLTSEAIHPAERTFLCENSEECQSLIMGSKCLPDYQSYCHCETDHILSSDATRCLKKVKEFGSPCEDNMQCSDLLGSGGICSENRCLCKDGYDHLGKICRTNQGYENDQKNFWSFNPRNIYDSDSRFRCTSHLECQSYIIGSECIYGKCKCGDNELLSSDATKCLRKVKEFGSPCEDNVQCSYLLKSGGICNEYNCSCKDGYHYLNGSCWKTIGLHEKCVRNEQCFSSYEYVGFECVNNSLRNDNTKTCECRKDYYHRLNSACRRKRYSGESCNIDDDCERNPCEGMKCRMNFNSNNTHVGEVGFGDFFSKWTNMGHLTCPTGMYELNGNCVRELGMSCQNDSQCNHIKDATCLDNLFCACKPVLFVASESNRECLRVARAKIDDISKTSCKKNPQCGVFGPHSYCGNQKRCKCKEGTYFEVESQYCWLIKSLQEKCYEDKDCHPSVTHAHCAQTRFSGKKCLCQDGYHQKNLECIPNALKVGDPCEHSEECFFPNSVCNDSNICECKEHHYFENGKCVPGVGSVCSNNENCTHLINTECKIGGTGIKQCLCKENQTHSKDIKYCLPVAGHKETCAKSFQCEFQLGPFAMCKKQICECQQAAHYSGGKCYKSKFVGESCSNKLDCFPGNDTNSVICLKGFCFCNYDYELDKNEICVKTNSATTGKFFSMSLMSLALLFLAVR